jgi:autotransporter-associated beta strand protein
MPTRDGTHDLIVINNNSTAGSSVVINSVIADNGANPVGLTAGSTLLATPTTTIQLGAANTFSGTTYITKGTLLLNNSLALQNSTLNYSLPGTLGFGSLTSATFGGLAGSSSLALPASFALTVGGNNANTVYSGALTGAGASLTKVGERHLDAQRGQWLHGRHHRQCGHAGARFSRFPCGNNFARLKREAGRFNGGAIIRWDLWCRAPA